MRPRIVEQCEPSHWPVSGFHDPRRCLLCLISRVLGRWIGLIGVEGINVQNDPLPSYFSRIGG